METLEELHNKASELVVDRWGSMPYTYCKYGHMDCSIDRGGQCFNEETDKELSKIVAHYK